MADDDQEPPKRPFRVMPALTPDVEFFWRSGEDGILRFLRCAHDGAWIHPPSPRCPECLGADLAPEPVSGRATVVACTVNHQPWYPDLDPPYSIAVVAIDEDPKVRLTTNVMGCPPDAVHIGQRVTVAFEAYPDHGGNVWLPMFRPLDDAEASADPGAPEGLDAAMEGRARHRPPPSASGRPVGERQAAISGIGQSRIGRRIYEDPLGLTLDACLAAIEDAGLTTADIDGLSTYPGNMSVPPGFSGAGITEVHDALRLELDWFSGGLESPGQFGSVVNAAAAVAAGLCNHALCFRSVWEASAQGDKGRAAVTAGAGGGGGFRASGFMQWTLPFGAPSAANWIGMMAARHFEVYGTTREQLARIALNARANAALNPDAIYRDAMTMEDYLGVRMVSTPLCLYDCDVPADGATAVVVSRADAAADLRKAPIGIEAVGTALRGRPSWDQFDDLTTMALRDAATMLWERTDLRPIDVDVAELYDGFSFITLCWLEALGFCGKGEGGPFIEDGTAIARDGVIPLNTHGGQLSAGRLHGYGFLHEACAQLWGECGERQVVRRGGRPEVAIAAAGGGPLAGALLLTSP